MRLEAVLDPERDESESAADMVLVTSEQPLAVARKHPITHEFLLEQLGRLGNTPYKLIGLDSKIDGAPMIPLSVLSRLRQELIAQLDQHTRQSPLRTVASSPVLPTLQRAIKTVNSLSEPQAPRLRILCRTLSQVRTVAEIDRSTSSESLPLLYADFQDLREYREAVEISHHHGLPIYLAPPRIQKPGEAGLLVAIQKYAADGILARNLSGIRFCIERQIPYVADYSLNVTNELTAEYLIQQQAQRLTASYDMNRDQLLQLVETIPARWLEVVIHQQMPMFHMEHCVFCSVLSPGTNKTNCGRPCDTHLVQLRDRIGCEHPLKADVGCRNTLYNAIPQSAAEVVPDLIHRGIRDFRVEFLDEGPTELVAILRLYRELLDGRIQGEEVWRKLKASNRVGVTRGTLEERRNPLAIL
jgi:putative protease